MELVIELRFERVDIGRVSLFVEPFVHCNEVLGLLFPGVIEWDMDCLNIDIEHIRERRGHTVQRLFVTSNFDSLTNMFVRPGQNAGCNRTVVGDIEYLQTHAPI